jgi:hypothetical protein
MKPNPENRHSAIPFQKIQIRHKMCVYLKAIMKPLWWKSKWQRLAETRGRWLSPSSTVTLDLCGVYMGSIFTGELRCMVREFKHPCIDCNDSKCYKLKLYPKYPKKTHSLFLFSQKEEYIQLSSKYNISRFCIIQVKKC